MKTLQRFLKKHSPLILSLLGSAGVIGSAVLAVKATPKALELIDEAESKKGEELTTLETVQAGWKPYVPTAITCVASISCIMGAHYLNRKTQASLMSAYALLNNMHQEYVNKTQELYGTEATKNIRSGIARDNYEQIIDLDKDEQTFYDFQTMNYFESTVNKVLAAENFLNEQLASVGYVTVNDFYRELGVKTLYYGDSIGWECDGNYKELIFDHQRTVMDDGLEVYIIAVNIPPDSYL